MVYVVGQRSRDLISPLEEKRQSRPRAGLPSLPSPPPCPAPSDSPAAVQQCSALTASKAGRHHTTCIHLSKSERDSKYCIMKITVLM